MKNIKFKELVTDNVFDFCAVLSAIGSEEIIGLFDKEQIEKIQEKSIELKDIGVVMATQICGVLIRNLAKARNEIYSFLAGCTEHEDGAKVTVDELKEMKFTEFIKIVRAFFGAAEIIAFANDVADAMGVSVDQEEQEQPAAEVPTV